MVAVVGSDYRPIMERSRTWRTETLPVPADLLVYTLSEWKRLEAEGGRFVRTLRAEARWLVLRPPLSPRLETERRPASAPASVERESGG